jgi:HD-GYP domain-containing protein (c-di-GMP phosphodiesterase class II)
MKKVRIENLEPGMIVAKSIYSADGRILVREQTTLNDGLIEKLKALGLPAAYIKAFTGRKLNDLVSDITRVDLIRSLSKLDTSVRGGKKLDLLESRKNLMPLIDEIYHSRNELVNDFPDIRMHNDYIYGHSVNVCVLAVKVGIKLGYNRSRLADLAIGALIHDIGMTQVPITILDKTTELTPEEIAIIRKHPETGYRMLSSIFGLSAVSTSVAYQHHERYNGTGYPRGMAGVSIHEFARIVAIADVFDSLTTEKVYRNAFSSKEALYHIASKIGTEFDPEITKVFVKIIER